MRYTILALTVALCLALVSSNPLPENGLRSETLDRLVMAETDNEAALRSKRTIGILRQLFPDISQRIEAKVNAIVAEVIRVLGPVLLRNVLGGGGNRPGVQRTNEGTSVTGTSPFGDEDEDEDDSETKSTNSNDSKVSISLPTFPPDDDETAETEAPGSSPSSTITESGDEVNATESIVTTTVSSLDNEVTASQ